MMTELDRQDKNRILYEMLLIMGITIIFSFLLPEYKSVITLLPLIYLLIERRKRKRSWQEIGFKLKHTSTDLKKNWYLVIAVAVVTQVLTLIIAINFLPGFIYHIQTRIPLVDPDHLIPLMIMLIVSTFGEEVIFRGFFQERLSWFISGPSAIIITSIIFAVLHYANGPVAIVLYDIITIFIDSIIYGIIYHKTKNIFASWVPHLLADVVGLTLIIYYFS